MPRQNISIDDRTRAQLEDLRAIYSDMSTAIEEGVARLHQWHFPDRYPEPPSVIGWDRIILAQIATCTDTGREMPAGSEAWREVWSDGRQGNIYSREALIADGILTNE